MSPATRRQKRLEAEHGSEVQVYWLQAVREHSRAHSEAVSWNICTDPECIERQQEFERRFLAVS